MKKYISLLIIVLCNLFFSIKIINAQAIIQEINSTQEISNNDYKIHLQEVAFKNTNQDFLIFSVETNLPQINLKNLQFYDDKIFKTVEEDFWVKNQDLITLIFNSDLKDNNQTKNLHTSHKGLTNTTEQVLISLNQEKLEFICWKKVPISQAEIKDFNKIWQKNLWDINDINSCIDSSQIKNNQILERIKSNQNQNSWKIKEENPLPLTTKSTTSKSSTKNQIPNLQEKQIEEEPIIQITEIFAYPENSNLPEWVEIKNNTNKNINLINWIIDDQEGGSKPKKLGQLIIPPNEFRAINLKELKINLNNTNDQIRLFNPQGILIDKVIYENARKAMSYALITIDGNSIWEYTKSPTPNQSNPQYITITGEIITLPNFENQYFFSLKSGDQIYQVIFDENVIKATTAKKLFKIGITGEFTGELMQNSSFNILKLHSYNIVSNNKEPQSNNNSINYIFAIIVMGISILYFLPNIKQWLKSHFGKYLSPSLEE